MADAEVIAKQGRRQREVRLRQVFSKRETSASRGESGRNKAGLRPEIHWVSWPLAARLSIAV